MIKRTVNILVVSALLHAGTGCGAPDGSLEERDPSADTTSAIRNFQPESCADEARAPYPQRRICLKDIKPAENAREAVANRAAITARVRSYFAAYPLTAIDSANAEAGV